MCENAHRNSLIRDIVLETSEKAQMLIYATTNFANKSIKKSYLGTFAEC
jgi:hypothetical protein